MQNSTVCPVNSDPFYVVTYYIKWVTASWTYSIVDEFLINFQTTNTTLVFTKHIL